MKRATAILGLAVALASAGCSASTEASSVSDQTTSASPTTPTTAAQPTSSLQGLADFDTLPVPDDELTDDVFGQETALFIEATLAERTRTPDEALFLVLYPRLSAGHVATENLLSDGEALDAGDVTCFAIATAREDDLRDGMLRVSVAIQEVYDLDLDHAFDIIVAAAGALCDPGDTAYVVTSLRDL
jgi:hypothetical protein